MSKLVMLPLGRLRLDGDTQSRAALSRETAEEYADLLRRGVELPPVVAFHDGQHYWLAHGFHRYHGHALAGRSHVACDVRAGTLEEARLFSAGCNTRNPLRRTAEDRKRAAWMALTSPLARDWDDARVAAHCLVEPALVAAVRASPAMTQRTLDGAEPVIPRTPAIALATGGTLRPEDAGRLTDADREKAMRQVERLVTKLIKKAAVLGIDALEVVRGRLESRVA